MGGFWYMLMFLKSKLVGPYVLEPLNMDRGMGRSLRLPQAGHGCGRIAARGEEYSMLYDILLLSKYARLRWGS